MSANREFYRPSGVCPPFGLLLGLACGVAAAVPAASVYSVAEFYSPSVYLNFLLCSLVGVAGAGAAHWGLKRGNVRSLPAALVAGVLSAAAGWYAAWIAWVAWLLHRPGIGFTPLVEIVRHPSILWETAVWINERGTWATSSGGEAVKGTELWLVWGLEAAALIGMAIVVAVATKNVFCENCGKWCEKEGGLGRIAWSEPEELRRRLVAGDFAALAALGRAAPSAPSWFDLTLRTCPDCRRLHALTVLAQLEPAKRGRFNMNVKNMFKSPNLLLDLLVDDREAEIIRKAAGAAPAFDGSV